MLANTDFRYKLCPAKASLPELFKALDNRAIDIIVRHFIIELK